MIEIIPSGLDCPIEIKLVQQTGNEQEIDSSEVDYDSSIFSLDRDFGTFTIDSKDREKEGIYQMTIVASIADSQQQEKSNFEVIMVDKCKEELNGEK